MLFFIPEIEQLLQTIEGDDVSATQYSCSVWNFKYDCKYASPVITMSNQWLLDSRSKLAVSVNTEWLGKFAWLWIEVCDQC